MEMSGSSSSSSGFESIPPYIVRKVSCTVIVTYVLRQSVNATGRICKRPRPILLR